MDIIEKIAENLNLPHQKIQNTINLIKEDNTIPFIARYRKEVTGNLDEVQIKEIADCLTRLENLEKRRQIILKSIDDSGKLTENLRKQILQAETITLLEDLYQPFRPKKKTRAMRAREKGLEDLANTILRQPVDEHSIDQYTSKYLNFLVKNQSEALQGASDIVAEIISENVSIRQELREKFKKSGKILVLKIADSKDEQKTYQDYYQFIQSIKNLRHYQVLAINRGEKENILNVTIEIEEQIWRDIILAEYSPVQKSKFKEILIAAIEDGAKRLLLPAIIRDIRRDLTQQAEMHAIKIFSENLRALLTQPPIPGHTIIGVDPGYRTGCKVAVVDPNGKHLDNATIYPHPPKNNLEHAYQTLLKFIDKYHASLIVIGNGTASRETEAFISEITKKNKNINYLITNEAGASVYSASEIARKELPELDVSLRGAVSIARRVQDPLAELVKIDPKSIGVGLYQHDINQAELYKALGQEIDSVVNAVGVEINTASPSLLAHVSGIGAHLAEKIVEYREKNGSFDNRNQLLNIQGIGKKTFEQAAGFIRIRESSNILDNTGIHPESYQLTQQVMEKLNISRDISADGLSKQVTKMKNGVDLNRLAEELGIGSIALSDILDELSHPGRDPRDSLPKPILRSDIISMNDLSPGMEIKGTIRNVVDFGAFVDIGVKIDGLLHRSKIPKNYNLKVGDVIDLKIVSIDNDRNRIALSMKETFDK